MSKFITLEGIDGAGKSTQLALMREWFAEKKIPVYFTREPGGCDLSEYLREIVLNPSWEMTALTELLLIFAARNEHIQRTILPKLANGISVISDRFIHSTYAYQGGGREIDCAIIRQLEKLVINKCQPNLTFILGLNTKIAALRVQNREKTDRIENENIQFKERVRAAFLQQVDSKRTFFVDASNTPLEVFSAIKIHLEKLYGLPDR